MRSCETADGGRFSYVLKSGGLEQEVHAPRRLFFSLTPTLLVVADRPELHAAVRTAIGGSPPLC